MKLINDIDKNVINGMLEVFIDKLYDYFDNLYLKLKFLLLFEFYLFVLNDKLVLE